MEPWTTARAEQYVSTALGVPDDLLEMMHWDRLMDDLYRAADQTWNVHLVDEDDFWMIVWANRRAATNDERAALVRSTMNTAREDMGADEDYVRSSMHERWERRRAATEHLTIARECPMGRVDAHDEALAVACSGDSDAYWRAALRSGAPRHAGPRARWEVLVIA